MQAVDKVEQRGQLVTLLVEFSSRAFPFAMPYTKHYMIIEPFILHVEDLLPKLERIDRAAVALYDSLKDAKENVLSLNYHLTLEHEDLKRRCDTYLRCTRPSKCGVKWSEYDDSISRLRTLEDVISDTTNVLQKSTKQLINTKAHIRSTRSLLLNAQSTLGRRWDVNMLLPELKSIVQASEDFEKLLIKRENHTIIAS